MTNKALNPLSKSGGSLVDNRHADGRFRAGHIKLGGRAPGTLNKWETTKAGWLEVFSLPLDVLDLTDQDHALALTYGIDTAGAWKLFQLLKNDEVQFFKVGVSFAPKLKVQESRSLNVDLNDLGSISTSDLLAVLGLSARHRTSRSR